jgi:hypothetical protein
MSITGKIVNGLVVLPPGTKDPIPIRPAGFFANCYGKEEIQEQNRLAKASVIRAPADLE